MPWKSIIVIVVLAFMAPTSDGFFFGSSSRRHDRPPVDRRQDALQPRPYWDPTWDRPYYGPSEVRRSYYDLPSDYYYSSATDSYYAGGSYYRRRAIPYSNHRRDQSYDRYPIRRPHSNHQTISRRVIQTDATEGFNSVQKKAPPKGVTITVAAPEPSEPSTEEEKAQNYMKNTELLVKIATRFDTQGCFRRLVCECEYYSGNHSSGSLTLEEKVILHVFGMKRRRELGDMDSARFLDAAATGEAARESGRPDPCPAMAPKCPQNMVKKLRSRKAKSS